MAKLIIESDKIHSLLTSFGYKTNNRMFYDHPDGHQMQLMHPNMVHVMGKNHGPYKKDDSVQIKDYHDLEDHLRDLHPYYHGRGN